MMVHITEPAPDIEPYVQGYLPSELATLLKFCLAKQPGDRPHDARAFARALKAIALPAEQRWTEARAQAWWRERSEGALPGAAQNPAGVTAGVA